MEITKRMEFDAAHRIPYHDSKCRNLHGHRYAVEVTVEGLVEDDKAGSVAGMILDFGTLAAAMAVIIDQWDHTLLLWKKDPAVDALLTVAGKYGWDIVVLDFVPTAERMAEHFAAVVNLELQIAIQSAYVSRVIVWETPTCKAEWTLGAME